MLIVTVTFATVAPDTAITHLLDDTARVRARPGNLGIDVLRDASTPAKIVLLQRWQDTASFEDHKKAEGMKTLGAKLMPLMSGPPETSVFEATHVSP